jgi:hypothetical protein
MRVREDATMKASRNCWFEGRCMEDALRVFVRRSTLARLHSVV